MWYLVPKSKDKHVIGTEWIFKNKQDKNWVIMTNKEIFALTARLESIRILLAITFSLRIKLYQMDVKSAFLNGILSEEFYVEQLKVFEDLKFPNHVYRLKITLLWIKTSS